MKRPHHDPRENAFLERPGETTPIPGTTLALRPMTLSTLMLMRRMDLRLLLGGAAAQDESAQFFEISAFAWLLSESPAKILAAFRAQAWREAVEIFGFSIPVTAIPALLAEVTRLAESLGASMVDILPRESDSALADDTPGE